MSKGSKSVSFEEYRNHNWKSYDNEREQGHNRINDYGRNFVQPGRFSRNQYEAASSFYEISQLHIPPPLEPQERLVRCVDPSFGRINGSSYIMPSSLTPASQVNNSRPDTIIPPPTAFRGEDAGNVGKSYLDMNYYFNTENSGHVIKNEESSYDIVEIKRPGTVCIRKNESDCGLACHYKPVSFHHGGGGDCEGVNSHMSLESGYNSPEQQRAHLCSTGLFNLPEVYSPPPLAPQHVSVLSTNSSQMHCLMPSFFVDAGNHKEQRQQQPLQKSPRLIYSEPVLKPEMNNKVCVQTQRTVRSDNAKLSPRMRNKTFIIHRSPRKNCQEDKRSYFPESNPAPENPSVYCGNRHLHEFSKGQQDDGSSGYMESDDNCHTRHDGRGDYFENSVAPKAKLSNHNILSPRANKLNRLQPSVITPAITESLLFECLDNLKSAHWEDNFEAFSQIYNLTELHPGRVKSILNKIIWHGLPHLSSPRTKLARMACICFKRLFQTQKRSMETEGEKVFYRLLDLCGGLANNFIQQESREALVAAVEFMDPLKSLSFLELHGAKHKNPHVREFSAYLLSAIMDELPQNKLMNKEFSPRIIPMIVSFLREGLLQTRLHAKLAMDKIFDHPTFESKLRRYVSPENVRHIADTLREFRERRSGNV